MVKVNKQKQKRIKPLKKDSLVATTFDPWKSEVIRPVIPSYTEATSSEPTDNTLALSNGFSGNKAIGMEQFKPSKTDICLMLDFKPSVNLAPKKCAVEKRIDFKRTNDPVDNVEDKQKLSRVVKRKSVDEGIADGTVSKKLKRTPECLEDSGFGSHEKPQIVQPSCATFSAPDVCDENELINGLNSTTIISKLMKKKNKTKKKPKRLGGNSRGFKGLTTIESTSKRDKSINRFLYYEFAEVTEQNDDIQSITELLDVSQTSIEDCGDVEVNKFSNKVEENLERSETKSVEKKERVKYDVTPVANGANVVLKKNSVIYIFGLVEVEVLFGTIEILGKKLDVTSKPVQVYSSRGTVFLSITNQNVSDENQLSTINQQLSEHGSLKLNTEYAIIYCKPIESKLVSFLEDNLAQVLFPKPENNVRCTFRDYEGEDWNVFRRNPHWDRIFEHVGNDSRIMLCGGKGVGKSTLLRFIINRLLERYDAVSVIDLDAGQAEFTIPGCVSSLVVREALLGPNYTHLQKPERCIFVPNMDISADYESYLNSIRELLKSPQLPPNIPTIINYMGYTKGLGLSLAAAAITEVRPTLVVQIDSPSSAKNYNCDLTPDNVTLNNSLSPAAGLSYELLKVESMSNGGNIWELQPRQMREMSILAYFSRILECDCSYLIENGVKVYRTELSDVRIIHEGKECDPMAVNANIVALCTKVDESSSVLQCHGWGIVRGVSLELNYLSLLTPLNEDELEVVDHLVLGSVSMPPSLYLRNHSQVTGLVPYVYEGDLHNFAKSPKRSIFPKKD